MTISDDQLSNWIKPWFNNEEERAEKTRETVKEAVENHLSDLDIRVFAKGSYPNNTNVRGDSDIDIAVEFEELIKLDYADGIEFSDTGLNHYTGISEQDFKLRLQQALEKEFGKGVVDSTGNKVFRIRGSDKILNADVIPCTTYRFYYGNSPYSYRQGIQLILNIPDGKRHFNYPDQHYKNGIEKNTSTMKRFKSVTRILKNTNSYLVENDDSALFPSFMIESLAYNINDLTYTGNSTWRDVILRGCEEIWEYLKVDELNLPESDRWKEVNEHKFLFHDHQIWTKNNARQFIQGAYNLLSN
ncbi:nucleotidyltransferase [Patescibacteria group bacterium]|jgi:predicted nucleotidyltransferase|nr:nucleotidyltransferase [Patescibacteria group bacterium]